MKTSLEKHSTWILTLFGMILVGLGVFYSTKGVADDALALSRKTEVDFKKHCAMADARQTATAESISDIKVSVADINGDIKSINTLLDERAKQDAEFKRRILDQLERLNK